MDKSFKIEKDKNSAMYWFTIVMDKKAESFLLTKQELNQIRADIENLISE